MIKLNKRIIISIFAAIMTFSLTGCVTVSFSGNVGQQEGIRGMGEMIIKEYTVPEYSAVRIAANITVVYKAASSDIVKVEIQENLMDYLDISVKNDYLVVESSKDFIVSDDNSPVIYITVPSLKELVFEGFVELKDWDPVRTDELTLRVNGTLSGELEIDVDKVAVKIGGIGNLTLSGRASQADIVMGGNGILKALGLETENASIRLSGMGEISLSCSDTLDIEVDGMGTVNYRGKPSITQKSSGMGSINSVD